jgi:hypothetical protein
MKILFLVEPTGLKSPSLRILGLVHICKEKELQTAIEDLKAAKQITFGGRVLVVDGDLIETE